MSATTTFWKPCSSCKNEIGFNVRFYECSVSTCTGSRTGYVFCSVPCWERHVPGAKHRDAAAVEKRSPTQNDFLKSQESVNVNNGQRRIIASASSTLNSTTSKKNDENEILVVVSKVKAYIKSQADMNVSDEIMDILSHRIRYFCDQAIKNAQSDGRKTVLDRDLKP